MVENARMGLPGLLGRVSPGGGPGDTRMDLSEFRGRIRALERNQHAAMAYTVRAVADEVADEYRRIESPYRRTGELIDSVRVRLLNQYAAQVSVEAEHASIIEHGHGVIRPLKSEDGFLHFQTQSGDWVVAREVDAWPGRHSLERAQDATGPETLVIARNALYRFAAVTGIGGLE